MILPISSGLCVLFLLIHSLYFRPHRATALILAFCLPAAMLYGGRDFYIINIPAPEIRFSETANTIPLVQLIGFFFSFYCSLSIAVHLFARRREDGARVMPLNMLVASMVIINIFVGLGIEYANFSIKWWSWRFPTTPFQLVGAWGWRPLMAMPLMLQFFIPRGVEIHWRPLWWRRLLAAAVLFSAAVFSARWIDNDLRIIFFIMSLAFAAAFLKFLFADVFHVLGAALRSSVLRKVILLSLVWFVFILVWMIIVDIIPILRYPTVLLWPGLIAATRIKSPDVMLDMFQFERPVPLFGRGAKTA